MKSNYKQQYNISVFFFVDQHVFVFQHDLNELFEQLNKFVFLEILGEIHEEKVEPYRSMVQRNFPNSQCHVEIAKFRLWI